MFSALAENQGDIKNKLNLYVALAPVAVLDNISNPFFVELAGKVDTISWWIDFFNIDELFGTTWQLASSGFCIFNPDFCRKADDLTIASREIKFRDDTVSLED